MERRRPAGWPGGVLAAGGGAFLTNWPPLSRIRTFIAPTSTLAGETPTGQPAGTPALLFALAPVFDSLKGPRKPVVARSAHTTGYPPRRLRRQFVRYAGERVPLRTQHHPARRHPAPSTTQPPSTQHSAPPRRIIPG